MVSKASEDFPDPDSPVKTTSWSRGISTARFLRLWTLAPWTRIDLDIGGIYRFALLDQADGRRGHLSLEVLERVAKHGRLFETELARGDQHRLFHPRDLQAQIIGQEVI